MILAEQVQTAVGAKTEELVLHLLIQLLVILVATRVVTVVVRRLGQTDVSGEILAGLLLGPSALGLLFPDLLPQLFHASTATIFVGIAQIGLILLMFQIGLEFEFGSQLGTRRPSTLVGSRPSACLAGFTERILAAAVRSSSSFCSASTPARPTRKSSSRLRW